MYEGDIVQAADGVYLVHGSNTNWTIVTDGGTATLIDTGYPGDKPAVLRSLEQLGIAPEAVAAVLITHAHTDHMGAADYFSTAYGVPVLMHAQEVPHAQREFLDQVSIGQIIANGWRPGVVPWAVHALRSGGKADVRVPEAREFPLSGTLDLPGRPLPVHTPGHTNGHCAYHLADVGVLVTGDALITAHPTSRIKGPQLLPRMFHKDRSRAHSSLDAIAAVPADTLLPGHGPLHTGTARQAAERARETHP